MILRLTTIAAAVLLLNGLALAQQQRATMVADTTIYIAPDASSAKLGQIGRGRELVILDHSREFLQVEMLPVEEPRDEAFEYDPNEGEQKTITGWVRDRAMVRSTTPDGDKIIFGEAADSEDEASRRHGRRGAARDAMLLYYRVYDFFPNSPLAGEALYRSADIRWQLERSDVMTRPSARAKESYLREGMHEQWMREVMKRFPGTKWADMAAFHLIENKLCGDWQGASKCPDKEADLYEKYASEHAQSPAAAEALYDAAWRRAALIEIYKTEANQKKSEESKSKALQLGQKVITQYPQSDWALRAQRLIFYIQQGVPTYGSATD